jgi:integrase
MRISFGSCNEKLPQHQQPVALLAYETGARKKELLRLKWSQIDLNRSMCLRTVKNLYEAYAQDGIKR